MNIEDWLNKHGIDYRQRGAWFQVHCPNCADDKYHGGIHSDNLTYTCFRCGKLPFRQTLEAICLNDPVAVLDLYHVSKKETYYDYTSREPMNQTVRLPINTEEITEKHKKYLRNRGFNPELIACLWKVKGTTDSSDYPWRLVIPVIYRRQTISWTARTVVNHPLRYANCPEEWEVGSIKDALYSYDMVQRDTIMVVEGATDAWRIGPGAVATMGATITDRQVSLIGAKKTRYIVLDPDARDKAEKLRDRLRMFSGRTMIIDIDEKDPALLKNEDINSLRRLLDR